MVYTFIQLFFQTGEVANLDIDPKKGFFLKILPISSEPISSEPISEFRGIFKGSQEVTFIGKELKKLKFSGLQDLGNSINFQLAELEFRLVLIDGNIFLNNCHNSGSSYRVEEILNFKLDSSPRFILTQGLKHSQVFQPIGTIQKIEVIGL